MSKDPAFLFYSSDFLSGVQDLTMDERGQYITLLCLQHQKGHLSEKMIRLSCGNAAADVLAKFRQDENGFYYNERLEVEIEKRKVHSLKQSDRAKEGWKKRKEKSDAAAYAMAMPLEDENENENKDVIKKERSVFKKPTIEHCQEYFTQKESTATEAIKFYQFYESKGWMVGKNKMKDWQAAASGWIARNKDSKQVKAEILPPTMQPTEL
jgi:uncharacterized protein YdaU (DUF1376 family)